MFLIRHLAAAITALAACGAAAPVAAQPQPTATAHPTEVACTNPASGATWQISIDYAQATVDANPAQVSDGEIRWHDAKDGGNYTLDRRSGNLTVVMASSTGGYFLHHHCRLPP